MSRTVRTHPILGRRKVPAGPVVSGFRVISGGAVPGTYRKEHPMKVTETNAVTGETRTRLSYTELGLIMLAEAGTDNCRDGYGTTDPEWVGRYALQYGDINPDGTLN